MSFIIDVCIVAVLFCFVVNGYKNGVVKSILSLVSTVMAFFISSYFSVIITNFIYDSFVVPSLTNKINSVVTNSYNNVVVPSEIINILPGLVINSFNDYGITNEKISNVIGSSVSQKVVASNLVDMFSPAFINLIRPIVIMVLFFTFKVVFRTLIDLVNKLLKLPIISQVNSFLGAILGVAKFSVILFIFVSLLRFSQPFINDSFPVFSEEVIDNTLILKKIYHNSYYDVIFES